MLQETEALKVKEKAKKMENYAKLVKQMHWPEVSPKKKKEMQNLRRSIDVKNRPLKSRFSVKNLRNGTDTENKKKLSSHKHTRSQMKIDWKKFHNPMIPSEKPQRAPIVTDYLMERRIKRDERDMDEFEEKPKQKNPALDWKSVLGKAFNDKEYSGLIKEKAKVIEQNARMQRKAAYYQDDIDGEDRANDMLIDALEAKLSILDKI